MEFFTRVLSGNSRLKERTREAEQVNEAFKSNLDSLKTLLQSEESTDVNALLDMVYESSFPEEQVFMKTPTQARLRSKKELVVRLLIGLETLGVPAMADLLVYIKKHGVEGIAHTLVSLLDLLSPLLDGKEAPEFTTDDVVDAMDFEWHSSSRKGSPLLNVIASATSSPRASAASVGDSPYPSFLAASPFRRVLSDRSMFLSRAHEVGAKSVLDKASSAKPSVEPTLTTSMSSQYPSSNQALHPDELMYSNIPPITLPPVEEISDSLDVSPKKGLQKKHRRKSSSLRQLFAEEIIEELMSEGSGGASSKLNSTGSSRRRTSSEFAKLSLNANEPSSPFLSRGASIEARIKQNSSQVSPPPEKLPDRREVDPGGLPVNLSNNNDKILNPVAMTASLMTPINNADGTTQHVGDAGTETSPPLDTILTSIDDKSPVESTLNTGPGNGTDLMLLESSDVEGSEGLDVATNAYSSSDNDDPLKLEQGSRNALVAYADDIGERNATQSVRSFVGTFDSQLPHEGTGLPLQEEMENSAAYSNDRTLSLAENIEDFAAYSEAPTIDESSLCLQDNMDNFAANNNAPTIIESTFPLQDNMEKPVAYTDAPTIQEDTLPLQENNKESFAASIDASTQLPPQENLENLAAYSTIDEKSLPVQESNIERSATHSDAPTTDVSSYCTLPPSENMESLADFTNAPTLEASSIPLKVNVEKSSASNAPPTINGESTLPLQGITENPAADRNNVCTNDELFRSVTEDPRVQVEHKYVLQRSTHQRSHSDSTPARSLFKGDSKNEEELNGSQSDRNSSAERLRRRFLERLGSVTGSMESLMMGKGESPDRVVEVVMQESMPWMTVDKRGEGSEGEREKESSSESDSESSSTSTSSSSSTDQDNIEGIVKEEDAEHACSISEDQHLQGESKVDPQHDTNRSHKGFGFLGILAPLLLPSSSIELDTYVSDGIHDQKSEQDLENAGKEVDESTLFNSREGESTFSNDESIYNSRPSIGNESTDVKDSIDTGHLQHDTNLGILAPLLLPSSSNELDNYVSDGIHDQESKEDLENTGNEVDGSTLLNSREGDSTFSKDESLYNPRCSIDSETTDVKGSIDTGHLQHDTNLGILAPLLLPSSSNELDSYVSAGIHDQKSKEDLESAGNEEHESTLFNSREGDSTFSKDESIYNPRRSIDSESTDIKGSIDTGHLQHDTNLGILAPLLLPSSSNELDSYVSDGIHDQKSEKDLEIACKESVDESTLFKSREGEYSFSKDESKRSIDSESTDDTKDSIDTGHLQHDTNLGIMAPLLLPSSSNELENYVSDGIYDQESKEDLENAGNEVDESTLFNSREGESTFSKDESIYNPRRSIDSESTDVKGSIDTRLLQHDTNLGILAPLLLPSSSISDGIHDQKSNEDLENTGNEVDESSLFNYREGESTFSKDESINNSSRSIDNGSTDVEDSIDTGHLHQVAHNQIPAETAKVNFPLSGSSAAVSIVEESPLPHEEGGIINIHILKHRDNGPMDVSHAMHGHSNSVSNGETTSEAWSSEPFDKNHQNEKAIFYLNAQVLPNLDGPSMNSESSTGGEVDALGVHQTLHREISPAISNLHENESGTHQKPDHNASSANVCLQEDLKILSEDEGSQSQRHEALELRELCDEFNVPSISSLQRHERVLSEDEGSESQRHEVLEMREQDDESHKHEYLSVGADHSFVEKTALLEAPVVLREMDNIVNAQPGEVVTLGVPLNNEDGHQQPVCESPELEKHLKDGDSQFEKLLSELDTAEEDVLFHGGITDVQGSNKIFEDGIPLEPADRQKMLFKIGDLRLDNEDNHPHVEVWNLGDGTMLSDVGDLRIGEKTERSYGGDSTIGKETMQSDEKDLRLDDATLGSDANLERDFVDQEGQFIVGGPGHIADLHESLASEEGLEGTRVVYEMSKNNICMHVHIPESQALASPEAREKAKEAASTMESEDLGLKLDRKAQSVKYPQVLDVGLQEEIMKKPCWEASEVVDVSSTHPLQVDEDNLNKSSGVADPAAQMREGVSAGPHTSVGLTCEQASVKDHQLPLSARTLDDFGPSHGLATANLSEPEHVLNQSAAIVHDPYMDRWDMETNAADSKQKRSHMGKLARGCLSCCRRPHTNP